VIKFLDTEQVRGALEVGQDHVRHLIRQGRLRAKKVGGAKGDYLVHPVDVSRLYTIRNLAAGVQDPLKPDVVWITEACNFLMEEVANFCPELIIGIAFGGLFPASFISSALRVPFCSLRVIHYDGASRMAEAYIAHDSQYLLFSNIRTLVVDDVVDSGDTLAAVHAHLLAKGVGADNLRFAVLHKKIHSKFEPNWYVDVVEGWVCYPWEVQDS